MAHKLSAVAELAVKYVNTTQKNIFLTGKAGTGKTTLLKHIIENTYKNAVVAAPTGIAAINAGGVTLHSLLQLPFGSFIPEDIPFNFDLQDKINTPRSVLSELKISAAKRSLLKETELLIIDEVSMLRADLLDCIDLILRNIRRRKNETFGGVQLLFIGDLNQLPPVVKKSEWPILSQFYHSPFFFDSHALRLNPPVFVELDKIYRQADHEFIEVLNRLRDNRLVEKDVRLLNSHYRDNFSPASNEGYIHITTHNRKSDIINQKKLEKLNTRAFNYYAKVSGDFPDHMFPVTEVITFKEGAQVMFIKNDPSGEGKFFNGKIGRITELTDNQIKIKLEDPDKIVTVSTYVWENKRYKVNAASNDVEEDIIGTFEQYPLKLAWSITVHKSQGLTFEKAILDLTDSFAPGQMYVALSRLTSLQGLVLSTPIPEKGIKIDEALSDFASTKKTYDSLNEDLSNDRRDFLISYTERSFSFSDILNELTQHLKSFDKDEKRSVKQRYQSWTLDLIRETTALQDITEKFVRQLRKIQLNAADNEYLGHLKERAAKAEEYFLPKVDILLEKIQSHKKEVGNKQQVKTYAGELKDIEAAYKAQIRKIKKARLLISYAAENKIPGKKDLQILIAPDTSTEKGKKKNQTREITLKLYREGMDIQEIALSRGLAYTTIEGHLSTFIASGELKATTFVNQGKLDQILTVVKALDTTLLHQIKEKLGEEFSYGDIKMAMAHNKYLDRKSLN